MKKVTGEDVKAAMLVQRITRVEHRKCSVCQGKLFFLRVRYDLLYHSACECMWQDPALFTWEDAADWINTQTSDEKKVETAALFGLFL